MSIPSKSLNFISKDPFAVATVRNYYSQFASESSGFGAKVRFFVSDTVVPNNKSIIVVSFNRTLDKNIKDLFKTIDLDLLFSKWYSDNILSNIRLPNFKNSSASALVSSFLANNFDASSTLKDLKSFDSTYKDMLTAFVNFIVSPSREAYVEVANNFDSIELFISFMESAIDLSFNDSSINEKLSLPQCRDNLSLVSFLLLGIDNRSFPVALTGLFIR